MQVDKAALRYRMCDGMCVPWHVCRGQRAAFENQYSPPTTGSRKQTHDRLAQNVISDSLSYLVSLQISFKELNKQANLK